MKSLIKLKNRISLDVKFLLQCTILFLICISFSNELIAQQNEIFSVGSIKAKRGEKVTGQLLIEKGIDQETFIPVSIINGVHAGPVLALVAGVHGTEFVPIIALQQLLKKLNPEELSGT